jgi:hypothetical protein
MKAYFIVCTPIASSFVFRSTFDLAAALRRTYGDFKNYDTERGRAGSL